jgi:hypothetical protein
VREINKYDIGYFNNQVTYNQWVSERNIYYIPMLFDVLTASLATLGFESYGTPTSVEDEVNHLWRVNIAEGIGGFVRLSDLNIPYTGPYTDSRLWTDVSIEALNATPWVEEDDVGSYQEAWTEEDGTYHPARWTGFLDFYTNSTIRANIANHTEGPSRIYRNDDNYYKDFAHWFVVWKHQFPTQTTRQLLLWGLSEYLRTGNQLFNGDEDHLGLWQIWTPKGEQLLLAEDKDGASFDHIVGSLLRHNTGQRDSTGHYNDWYDYANNVLHKDAEEGNSCACEIIRRGEDVILIFSEVKEIIFENSPPIDSFISLPHPVESILVDGVPTDFYTQFPFLNKTQNPAVWHETSAGRANVVGYRIKREDLVGTGIYWVTDVVHVKTNPGVSFSYLYAANTYYEDDESLVDPIETLWGWFYLDDYTDTNDTTLFVDGGGTKNSYIPLYHEGGVDGTTNLYTTLHTQNATPSATTSLFLYHDQEPGEISLQVTGIPYYDNDNINLFTYDGTGLEDFTTYTQTDPSGYHTDLSYNRLVVDGSGNASARLYYDFGSEYFNRGYTINFEFDAHNFTGSNIIAPLEMSNVTNSAVDWEGGQEEAIVCYVQESGLYLEAYETATVSASGEFEMNRHYYCTFTRDRDSDGQDQVQVQGWLNSGKVGTAEIDLSLDIESTSHRYLFVGDNWNQSDDTINSKCVVENVGLSNMQAPGFLNLVTQTHATSTQGKTLHIEGWSESQNSYTILYTFGGTAGWYWDIGSTTLYINDGGEVTDTATLFLYNDEPYVEFNRGATLYMVGAYNTSAASISLVTVMATDNSYATLYINAPGNYGGFVPDTDQLPTYLHRPNESDSITMFLHNVWVEDNSYITLNTRAVLGEPNDNITLAFPNILGGIPNTYTTLHTQGAVPVTDNTTLVIPSTVDPENDNITLVCYHGGSEPNTYCSCYVFGANLINNNVTLAMADVIGTSNDNVNLHIRGY